MACGSSLSRSTSTGNETARRVIGPLNLAYLLVSCLSGATRPTLIAYLSLLVFDLLQSGVPRATFTNSLPFRSRDRYVASGSCWGSHRFYKASNHLLDRRASPIAMHTTTTATAIATTTIGEPYYQRCHYHYHYHNRRCLS